MAEIKLIATSTFGMEALVKREVMDLGYEIVKVENGSVIFRADEGAIARANIWLRTAERVRVWMGEFRATTFDDLFEGTKALPWLDWLSEDANFIVEGKSIKSKLHSVPTCQSIVERAVIDSLRQRYNRDRFGKTGATYKIEVAILNDMATLSIDTSGAGLHKRGYRDHISKAPLKETMAAGLIKLSYWNPDRVLIDPFCGSGTIPIEAALIGKNIAPGINRNFVAQDWARLSQKIWDQAFEEAEDLAQRDRKLSIIGTDIDEQVIKTARRNAYEAYVDEDIHFQVMPIDQLQSSKKYGCTITNPPYGERLGDEEEVQKIYREMGKVYKRLDTWSHYILTGHEAFETFYGKKADRNRKLYNGNIKTYYYQYQGPRPPQINKA